VIINQTTAVSEAVKVPCGGCTSCCTHHEKVLLTDGDDPARYEGNIQWIRLSSDPEGMSRLALTHKPNGDCVYLGENGCTIYPDRPHICRIFDCREVYRRFMQQPRNVRRQQMKVRGKEAALATGKIMLEKHPTDWSPNHGTNRCVGLFPIIFVGAR
jgi:hypothetical protein